MKSRINAIPVEENEFCKHVLDKGFVRLVEWSGDDYAPARAARISYGRESKGKEQDEKLLGYLLDNRHDTPWEMIWFKWHVKCPIFVARQWMRHRSNSFNELSGRYTTFEPEFYIPVRGRIKSIDNKQGSVEVTDYQAMKEERGEEFAQKFPFKGDWNQDVISTIEGVSQHAYEMYEHLIRIGVANEMARMVLPVNLYTEFYYAVNARSLMNFLSLRLHPHAQLEIREYADRIMTILQYTHPVMMRLFLKNQEGA
jgi:thymidylate synthase (FAD)